MIQQTKNPAIQVSISQTDCFESENMLASFPEKIHYCHINKQIERINSMPKYPAK